MYAKFVGHLEGNGNGVLSSKGGAITAPQDVAVFEGDEIYYTKMSFLTVKDWNKWMKENAASMNVVTGEVREEWGALEMVKVTIRKDGEENRKLYAPNSSFYLLNNEGKTIDRLWCARFEDQRKMLVSENTRDRG